MVKHEREDIDHLTITAGAAQHLILQLPKGQAAIPERARQRKAPGLRWMTAR